MALCCPLRYFKHLVIQLAVQQQALATTPAVARLGSLSRAAADVHLSQPAMTQTIGQMVAAGLLECRASPADARIKLIRLSAAGVEAAEALSALWQQVAQAVGKSRTTVTNLIRLLDLNAEVKRLVEDGVIEGVDPADINGTSIDLHLGDMLVLGLRVIAHTGTQRRLFRGPALDTESLQTLDQHLQLAPDERTQMRLLLRLDDGKEACEPLVLHLFRNLVTARGRLYFIVNEAPTSLAGPESPPATGIGGWTTRLSTTREPTGCATRSRLLGPECRTARTSLLQCAPRRPPKTSPMPLSQGSRRPF